MPTAMRLVPAVFLLLLLLLQACGREEPGTLVVRPLAAKPAASAAVLFRKLPATTDGPALLAARRPRMPVEGVGPAGVRDNFAETRGIRRHNALDIMAPRGTRVIAVDDGKVAKLHRSIGGGITIYQFDPHSQLVYFYAHLDRYADGLKEGIQLRRGDLIGYVGSTGNAPAKAPHLHFAVYRLGPDQRWWKGDPVNPYAALQLAALQSP